MPLFHCCAAAGKTSPWPPSTAWRGCRRGSKEERVGWAGQQSWGKGEAGSAGVSAAGSQHQEERLWIHGQDSLWYQMRHDFYLSVLNFIVLHCLLLWFHELTTVSFQKKGKYVFTFKRPKVNDEFDSVWSNHLGKAQLMVAIEQMENYDFVLNGVNVEIPKKTPNNVTKSNKCNQCDYASSRASHLRTHLKTHSGEKSNKCNQCEYTSSQTSHLRTHLKMHSGESQTNANNATLPLLKQAIWGNILNPTVEKSHSNATNASRHFLKQAI